MKALRGNSMRDKAESNRGGGGGTAVGFRGIDEQIENMLPPLPNGCDEEFTGRNSGRKRAGSIEPLGKVIKRAAAEIASSTSGLLGTP